MTVAAAETGKVCARGALGAAASLKDARLKRIAGKNIAFAELQKNQPKPLKTRSRAQNRAPFDRALGDFALGSDCATREVLAIEQAPKAAPPTQETPRQADR